LISKANTMIRRICCAFSDPGLLELLHQHSVTEIEIIGIDGCYCVASSAVDACKSGFHVTLPCEFIGVRNMAKFEEKKKPIFYFPYSGKREKRRVPRGLPCASTLPQIIILEQTTGKVK
jgi:hypothetical protein